MLEIFRHRTGCVQEFGTNLVCGRTWLARLFDGGQLADFSASGGSADFVREEEYLICPHLAAEISNTSM